MKWWSPFVVAVVVADDVGELVAARVAAGVDGLLSCLSLQSPLACLDNSS